MISHDKAQALISARYDELLSPAETRAVQEHLASCAACRQFAAETDRLVSGLRTLPQLPPSPRVSRAVQDGIRGGVSPWGWLGRGMRIATSPALAVASSLVLVAALAFIIVLALRPLGLDEQPRATISAMADVIETPTTEPERTPITAPTVAPTEPAVSAPTQEPTPAPTARLTNVAPPTQTPVSTAVVEPTAVPTQRSIVTRETPTVAPVVETPEPTVAPPVVPEPTPAATQVPEQPAAVEAAPTSVVEIANQAVTAEPTSPPILPADEGAPFTGDDPVAVDEGSEAPPAYEQPAIEQGGPNEGATVDPVEDVAVDQGAGDVTIAAEPLVETAVPATSVAATEQPVAAAAESTAPPVAPTSTPVQIMAAENAPPPASGEAPQLEPRTGNEAVSMDGESMVAEIQATVQAGLTDDSGPPTFPPEPTPLPTTPAQADLTAMTPTIPAGDAAIIQPGGAEITGAPGSGSAPLMTEDVPPVADVAAAEGADVAPEIAPDVAPIEAASDQVPADQVPVAPQVVGAPEPQWPGIGGGGTQFMSNSGYSAIADGGGVTVYGPDGTPLGWVGSGVPIWSPGGTSLLVIGPDGLGAVWDVNAGPIPVERPETGARDIPVGWYDGSPLVQRVYFDGSGRVELRVVPISGAAGYAIGTATTDSAFGEGVTAAKLSPDGGQISFVSGGQLYIAPVSDPGSATPAG